MGRSRRTPYAAPRLGLLLAGWRDRGGLGPLGLVLARHRILELAHAASERAAEVRKPLRAEHDQHDDEDDDQFHGAGSRHSSPMVAARGTAAALPGNSVNLISSSSPHFRYRWQRMEPMDAQGDNGHFTKRVTLPSGKTIEVVYFADEGFLPEPEAPVHS